MKSVKTILCIAGCSVVVIAITGLIFFGYTMLQIKKATTAVHDINKYESILAQWEEFAPDIVDHFPVPIPPDAQNTKFYFMPGWLQMDSRIELRYRTTPENIADLYEKFSKLKTEFYYGGELRYFPPDGGEADFIELEDDWETMQFDEDPENLPEHSKEHGVIISREKNEIIYWAQW